MEIPKLSIITINFNNNCGLKSTLESIKLQSFTDYEHIIIDAGSSDGSKTTIEKYEKESSHLTYWISESDKGIYDGMNKGIKQAKGEYIYFLNQGIAYKEISSNAYHSMKTYSIYMEICYLLKKKANVRE